MTLFFLVLVAILEGQKVGRVQIKVERADKLVDIDRDVEQARTASSIAASMTRRGNWPQFSVHHLLGVGVRSDAALRTSRAFIAIDETLVDLVSQFPQLTEIAQSIGALREDVKALEQEFLGQALALGRIAFKTQLDEANELWRECDGQWGLGSGRYRADVADILQGWFDSNNELDSARRTVDSGLNQAWRELVLQPLIAATRDSDMAA